MSPILTPMHPGFSLIGAGKDLGLSIRWRFAFAPPGSTISRSTDVLCLDVGGRLELGVIDHHQGEPGATSTARLVHDHPDLVHEHLVGPWIASARTSELKGRPWSPTVLLHEHPDFDAIASTVLAMHLVEEGAFPDSARSLVAYADRVDQGAERPRLPEQRFDLYPLILMLQHLPRDDRDRDAKGLPSSMPTRKELARIAGRDELGDLADAGHDESTLRLGMMLVRRWLARPGRPGDREALHRLSKDDPLAARIAEAIEEDWSRFAQAIARDRVRFGTVLLPSIDPLGEPVEVPSAVLPLPPTREVMGAIACDKIYLRVGLAPSAPRATAGAADQPDAAPPARSPFTVIEKPFGPPAGEVADPRPGDPPRRSRWIIALDEASSAVEPASRASLRGLGASLEWAEQRKRRRLAGVPRREGPSRFPEFPGIADPWYDGRGHRWTIVDSPHDGTVLDQGEVEEIIASRFWEPEVESVSAWLWTPTRVPCSGFPKEVMRLGATVDRMRDLLQSVVDARLHPDPSSSMQRPTALSRSADAAPPLFGLIAMHLHPGWSEESLHARLRDLLGGSPQAHRLAVGRAFVGPRAAVVLLDRPDQRFEPDPLLDRLFRLVHDLAAIDDRAGRLNGIELEGDTIGVGRDLRMRFVKASAEYRAQPPLATADQRSLREAVERAIDLDQHLAATGILLEHLDDDAQRTLDSRLNRLVVVLALFGIVEVLTITLAAIETAWIEDPIIQGRFDVAMSIGLGVMTLLLLTVAITLPVGRWAKWYACIPPFGRLLFPEERHQRRTRRS